MNMSLSSGATCDNGDSFIPASQRPDGTWRKARRVKEGYVPQEEVPLYESKGKQMTKKPEPIILPSGQVGHRVIPGLIILEEEKKPAKKKKSKTKVDGLTTKLDNVKISEKGKKGGEAPKKPLQPEPTTDPVKKLRNLKKRLREVEALEEKLKNGLIAKPEPEQLEKIQRKKDLLYQINTLEKQVS